jgi:hypothetical protein
MDNLFRLLCVWYINTTLAPLSSLPPSECEYEHPSTWLKCAQTFDKHMHLIGLSFHDAIARLAGNGSVIPTKVTSSSSVLIPHRLASPDLQNSERHTLHWIFRYKPECLLFWTRPQQWEYTCLLARASVAMRRIVFAHNDFCSSPMGKGYLRGPVQRSIYNLQF